MSTDTSSTDTSTGFESPLIARLHGHILWIVSSVKELKNKDGSTKGYDLIAQRLFDTDSSSKESDTSDVFEYAFARTEFLAEELCDIPAVSEYATRVGDIVLGRKRLDTRGDVVVKDGRFQLEDWTPVTNRFASFFMALIYPGTVFRYKIENAYALKEYKKHPIKMFADTATLENYTKKGYFSDTAGTTDEQHYNRHVTLWRRDTTIYGENMTLFAQAHLFGAITATLYGQYDISMLEATFKSLDLDYSHLAPRKKTASVPTPYTEESIPTVTKDIKPADNQHVVSKATNSQPRATENVWKPIDPAQLFQQAEIDRKIQEAFELGRQKGDYDGYQKGHHYGYNMGFDKGYQDGMKVGFTACVDAMKK